MKRILTAIICALSAVLTHAQTATEHMTFLNTPIDGTVSSFVTKMEGKGLKFNANIDKNAVMLGSYAGYKGCTAFIQSCSKKDLVFAVGVTFEHKQQWDSLAANYYDLKARLTEKYGKPAECTEKFDTDAAATSDSKQKMDLTVQGKCDYLTVWQTKQGTINLAISNAQYGEETVCYVQLDYIDKQNVAYEKTITKTTTVTQ